MSTGLNCEFVEVKKDTWYLILEDGSAPKNAWDWREFAHAYGPFTTMDAGRAYLSRNFANPGGWSVINYDVNNPVDETLKKLIKKATKRDDWF